MKKSFSQVLLMAVLTYLPVCPQVKGADQETNCPAAFRPYSADTPLLDLLINPATKAIVQRDLPGLLEGMPKMLTGATPPTLADVLTIRVISGEFMKVPEATLSKLDKDLAEVPNTRESAVARCGRYDHVAPTLPEKIEHPAILVFSKSNGFRDDPSVNAGLALLKEIGERRHYGMVFTEKRRCSTRKI